VSIDVKTVDRYEPAAATTTFDLAGLLERGGRVDAAAFDASRVTSVTTVAASGHGGEHIEPRNYSGMRVYDLLKDAGIRLNPEVNEDFLSKVVVVRGADGHAAAFAGGELEPRFMNGDVIVATRRDGQPLPESEGATRLIVPFDRKPGRWAKGVVSIELREG
jgi:hypothetical protein